LRIIDLREADLRAIFGMVEGEFVTPFIGLAEISLDARGDVVRERAVPGRADIEAARPAAS